MAWTRAPAQITATDFSMFDGSIRGTFVSNEAGKQFTQKWRFNSWPADHFSTVTLTFASPKHGQTVLTLKHIDLPDADEAASTEKGWRGNIFHKIHATFGF